MFWCSQRPVESYPLELELHGSCKLSDIDSESEKSVLLEDKYAFLITEPFLQPQTFACFSLIDHDNKYIPASKDYSENQVR